MSDNKPYTVKTYLSLALDPLHVGTGGYRLGRVDMSIVRESGTNVPKVPGTSISGACRAYAAMQIDSKYPRCAGQGQEDKKKGKQGHCGQNDCPVCTTFGYAKGDKGGFRGLAAFGDARVLFFPVSSLVGPVWVTCPAVLEEVFEVRVDLPDKDAFRLIADFDGFQDNAARDKRLNFGWLMLAEDAAGDFTLDWDKGDNIKKLPDALRRRVVLVSDKLFGQIVNDNLEVRTSVSIDPETGAAEGGMLFTYEALPRGTVLWFEVVYSNKKFFRVKGKEPEHPPKPAVERGLKLFEHLGVGGMGTRGMGRLRVLGLPTNGSTN